MPYQEPIANLAISHGRSCLPIDLAKSDSTVISNAIGVAFRGGVPVCFPQFGDMGPVKAQHGFARNTEFTVVKATGDSVTLSLSPDKDQRQGDFPDHTLLVKVLHACIIPCRGCTHVMSYTASACSTCSKSEV